MEPSRKSVLIAGGGFAGLAAARELCETYYVTLVDPKSYFEYVPCTSHTIVSPTKADRMLVDYPAGLHKQGLLVGLTSDGTRGQATLQGGEVLYFDYALLCTGSSYPSGIKAATNKLHDRAGRLQEFANVHAKIMAAQTVVVVGGGAVGVEVASEVAETFPDKKVTLLASGGLLERMAPQAQQYAEEWLCKHNVEVLTGESEFVTGVA